MPVGRLRQTEQPLQQPMHAGRPEQVLAPHHIGDALQGVVDHHREVIAGRRLLARQDDVAPGLRPGGHRAGLAVGTLAMLDPAEVAGARAAPPPCRAAAHRARRIQTVARAHPAPAISPCRDTAARHRDRAATARSPRAPPPVLRFRRGFRRRDRPGPRLRVFPAPRDIRQDVRIAAAPASPRRCRARRGLRRSRPRIPACSWWRRYPRCAAATGRRLRAPDRNSAAPNKRGRDADSRSGSAQSGKRVAALISSCRACPAIHVARVDMTCVTLSPWMPERRNDSSTSTPRPTSKTPSTRWSSRIRG